MNQNTSSSVAVTINPSSKIKPNEAEGSMVPCEGSIIQVTMGMFFDGTGNNKFNTDDPSSTENSYGNSYSNIARSWHYYRGTLNGEPLTNPQPIGSEEGFNFNIYVQGIGTKRGLTDDLFFGHALAIDSVSGIRARVREGTEDAAKAIMEHEEIKNTINSISKIEITFDVFGFSRGAAAARHFIHLNTEQHTEGNFASFDVFNNYLDFCINTFVEEERKIEVEIHWRFAGLYETVSSHAEGFGFHDVSELGLDKISNTEFTVHIVAKDEYRKNFSLTEVNSAPNNKVITLPGVHSDIGGGYINNSIEDYQLYNIGFGLFTSNSENFANQEIKSVKDWFLNNGWYKEQSNNSDDNLEIIRMDVGQFFILNGKRKNIKNNYSHIALHIMTELAIEKGVDFDRAIFDKYRVYNDVFLGSLLDTFDGKELDLSSFTDFQLKQFRYEYLHISSRFGETGHDPRLDDNSVFHPKFKRKIIPDT